MNLLRRAVPVVAALALASAVVDVASPSSAGAAPIDVGQWSPKMSWPIVAIHTIPLHTGKVLAVDGWELPTANARVWDPATNTFTSRPVNSGVFCSGHVQLADGRILVAGGHAGGEVGIKDTNVFDPVAMSWTRVADMKVARWYPSVTTLGDGRIVAISGQVTHGVFADTPEVYDPATNTWTLLTGASTSNIHETEYPLSFLMPDGRIFVYAITTGQTGFLDVNARTWTVGPRTTVVNGSAAMYRPGLVIVSGETAGAATSALIDLNAASPVWRAAGLPGALRYEHNLVVLADGKVMAVGGSQSSTNNFAPVLTNEIWDPATETWSSVAAMADPRMYHSTALLQRDGTLLAAGGGRFSIAPDVLSAEVYSPPYLFRGARPTITSSPARADYGATLEVGTPDAASVASVFLAKLPAVTHTLNMDPQFVSLPVTPSAGGVTVTTPANANVAPPGYYMLFLVNASGVPSVSAQIQIGRFDTQAPTAPSSLAAAGAAGSASLSWAASTDNVSVTAYNVHRSTSPGFTPSLANRVQQVPAAAFIDVPPAAGTYYYRVTAQDGAGNVSPASNEAQAVVTPDTTAPSVSISEPSAGASVANTISVAALASDAVGVAGVQFRVDGVNHGAEDTIAPYSVLWDTRGVTNGTHTLSAVARDAAGNVSTSAPISVSVANTGPAGLVGAWAFNEGSGTAAGDVSGSANHGSLINATWSTSGRFGGALSFNGSSAFVSVPDAPSLDLTTGMTLEAWVNPAAAMGSSWRTIVLKEQTDQLVYALYANGDTSRPLGQMWVGGGERKVTGTAAVAVNTWTHLATTYDGATQRLFVNGVQVASGAQTGLIATSASPLRIGGNAIWGELFEGRIDEVRVYNRALTATEIQTDMNTGIGGGSPPPPPPPPPPQDTEAPSAPAGLTASGGVGAVSLAWVASTDNVAVTAYNVHRSTSPGFTPALANRVGQPSSNGFADSGLAAGTYYYRVTAQDAAGNVSSASNEATAVVTAPPASGWRSGGGVVVQRGVGVDGGGCVGECEPWVVDQRVVVDVGSVRGCSVVQRVQRLRLGAGCAVVGSDGRDDVGGVGEPGGRDGDGVADRRTQGTAGGSRVLAVREHEHEPAQRAGRGRHARADGDRHRGGGGQHVDPSGHDL